VIAVLRSVWRLLVLAGLVGLGLLVQREQLWGGVLVALLAAAALLGVGALTLALLQRAGRRRRLLGRSLADLDAMSGDGFEDWVVEALARAGFDCENLPRTRDFGIDVVARRGKLRVGVQAKRYDGPVGNSAVQQAIAGAGHHDCAVAAVVTQSRFTAAAREQARTARLPVVLIERADLEDLGRQLRRARA
jgi:restriction system protein